MTDDEIRALLDACKFLSDGEAKAITDLANAALEARAERDKLRDRLAVVEGDRDALRKAAQWTRLAVSSLIGYERDLGCGVDDMIEVGKIDDSRYTPSFRIRIGHIRGLFAALQSTPAQKEQSDE